MKDEIETLKTVIQLCENAEWAMSYLGQDLAADNVQRLIRYAAGHLAKLSGDFPDPSD
jgi:hypothetical protein